jgi:hypothetical protein
MQLAAHPWVAVFASFLAIAIESLVLTSAFIRNEWYRLAMGLGAVALIAGFGVFMGVFWPGWWVPLLGFLPWTRLSSRLTPAPTNDGKYVEAGSRNDGEYVGGGVSRLGGRALTLAQLVMIIAVIAQQIVVSAMKLERAPMFSWYDMYSGTYANAAAFTAARPPRFRIVAATPAGTVEIGGCNPHEEFVRQFEAAVGGSLEDQAAVWEALRDCGDLTGVRSVILEGDLNTFDFDRLQFTTTRSARLIGPLSRAHANASDH